jgi:hypothetical protein
MDFPELQFLERLSFEGVRGGIAKIEASLHDLHIDCCSKLGTLEFCWTARETQRAHRFMEQDATVTLMMRQRIVGRILHHTAEMTQCHDMLQAEETEFNSFDTRDESLFKDTEVKIEENRAAEGDRWADFHLGSVATLRRNALQRRKLFAELCFFIKLTL